MFNPYSNDTRVSKELNFRALAATASRSFNTVALFTLEHRAPFANNKLHYRDGNNGNRATWYIVLRGI